MPQKSSAWTPVDESAWTPISTESPNATSSNDTRNSIQRSFDENTRTDPKEPLLETGLKSVVGAIGAPFVHPIDTAKGLLNLIPDSPDLPLPSTHGNPLVERGVQAYHDYKEGGLPYAGTKLAGETLGSLATGEAAGLMGEAAGGAGTALRESAAGSPDAAALRGLQIGPRSPKTLRTLSDIQSARPYLAGVGDLKELQARVPEAKAEIWAPYQAALEKIGDTQTGFGTLRDLEDQRLQTSAQLRNLRSRNPEAIQLAEQKGMTEANLLASDRQIKSLLDPYLYQEGLNPRATRTLFGQVSRIGEKMSGKSTINEAEQPYGFGKITQLDIHKPLQAPAQIASGLKDLVAGRPLFSGKPTDIAIREGFRGTRAPIKLSDEESANPFINRVDDAKSALFASRK